MNNYTHHTAPTSFIEADGTRYAYRRFGKNHGLPLVFIPHILGNMDSWDPSVTDGFAKDREVILFNNAGIASSSGEVRSPSQRWRGVQACLSTLLDSRKWTFSASPSDR